MSKRRKRHHANAPPQRDRQSLREMLGVLSQRQARIPVKRMKKLQSEGPRKLWAAIINSDKRIAA